MKKQIIASILVWFSCLGASVVDAQGYWVLPEGAGPYVRFGAGPSFFENGTLRQFSLEGFPAFSPQNQPVNFRVGAAVDGAVGYAFDKYFGLDFETGYIWARIDHIPGYDTDRSSIGNVPLLVNATLTLPIPHTIIVPYVGVGAGGAVSIFDAHSFGDQGQIQTAYGSESDTVFAYQAFAGVRFMIARNVSLGVGYKYFATANTTYSYPPSPNLDIGFKGARTHSILFTAEWEF